MGDQMGNLINFIVKISGFGWVWEKLDGYKTKVAAIMGTIDGLAHLLLAITGFAASVSPTLAAHNTGALIKLAGELGNDPNWQALLTAWRSFYASLGVLGIGHKLEKAADVAGPSAPPQISLGAISMPVVSPTTQEQSK